MKKFLLLASAALIGSGAMVAEEIDITPKNYHFNEANALPIFNHGVHGANLQGITSANDITAPVYQNLGAAEQWNEGLLVLGGGQWHNHDLGYYPGMVAGLQLLDLGGEVGQVLAFIGQNQTETVKELLKEHTGFDYDVTAGCTASNLNWGNMNFFTDIRNTPTAKDGYIRTTITYNIVSDHPATQVMDNVQFKTNENGMKCSGGEWTAKGNLGYDDDEEKEVYDPTIWQVYSIEGYCPDSETAKDFFPMRATLNFPGNIPSYKAFFIKDITFTHVTDGIPALGNKENSFKTITLKMGEPAGVKNIVAEKNVTFSVNGNSVTFSAAAEVYTVAGVKVANAAAAQSVNLPAGIYVAKAGEKAFKFVVK